MGAFLGVALTFWIAPIVVAQLIGRRKNRAGWVYGFLFGWLGVIIVALRDAKISVVTIPATVHAFALAASPVVPAPSSPPAGWYSDPHTPGQVRWWDGTAWTAFTDAAGDTPRPPGVLASR